jgi:hypothetical protein
MWTATAQRRSSSSSRAREVLSSRCVFRTAWIEQELDRTEDATAGRALIGGPLGLVNSLSGLSQWVRQSVCVRGTRGGTGATWCAVRSGRSTRLSVMHSNRRSDCSCLPRTARFLGDAGGERLDCPVRLPACEPEPLQGFDDLHQLGRDGAGEYGRGTLLGEYRRSRNG